MIQARPFPNGRVLNTPILFLIFNRLSTTKEVLRSINDVKPSKLYIASDGPRHNKKGESKKVDLVREYILSNINWECEVKTLFRKENLGCKYAVSSAITWFFENEEQGIILEDDCLPTQSFFWYCEELLNKYKYDTRIWHISGSNFQKIDTLNDLSYYFSKYVHIWGWACWADRWAKYDVEMKSYKHSEFAETFKNIVSDPSESLFWSNIFYKVSKGKIDTWDYQWVYTSWKNNGLSIEPNVNLVSNIGFGEESTHTRDMDSELANMNVLDLIFPLNHPNSIERNIEADLVTAKKMFSNPNFFYRVLRRLLIELKILIKKIKSSNQNIS